MSTTARTLLAKVLEAHAGIDRWRSFTQVTAKVVTGGFLYDLFGASVLGKQAPVLCTQTHHHPGRGQRFPGRALSSPSELDGARVSEADSLQQAHEGRTLRRVGAA